MNMTIKTNFLFALGVTALVMFACKNDKPVAGQSDELPPPNPDTLIGFNGTEKCGYSPRSKDTTDFFFQKYRVSIVQKSDGSGQNITVSELMGENPFDLNLGDDYTFKGISRNFIFFSQGTAPDIRQILIYDLVKRIPIFKDTYCDTLFLASNSKLWFWAPVDKSAVKKLPECPDSAQWVKDGLQCGYAQRKLYDPISNAMAVKSEYICFARQ